MFEVSIESEEFRGLKTVKQHMMVNKVGVHAVSVNGQV